MPSPTGHTHSESALDIPSLSRTLLYVGRALRLRCPNCGKGKVITGWTKVRERCSVCGLRFARGEGEYFYAGAIFVNIVIAELLFAFGFGGALILMWPNVPWDAVTYVGAALMLLLPALLLPVVKVLWLAFDMLMRPVTPTELDPNSPPPAPPPRPRPHA